MCKAEIKEEYFNKGPILLVVVILYEIDLEFLYLLKTVLKLEESSNPEKANIEIISR